MTVDGYWLSWTTSTPRCTHHWREGHYEERGDATTIVTHRRTYECDYCAAIWVRVSGRDLREYGVFR